MSSAKTDSSVCVPYKSIVVLFFCFLTNIFRAHKQTKEEKRRRRRRKKVWYKMNKQTKKVKKTYYRKNEEEKNTKDKLKGMRMWEKKIPI